MSDTTQENDPSIEEILASIRQIISDDEEEATEEVAEAPAEEEIAEPEEPVEDEGKDEDILELTDKVEDEPEESHSEPEPAPEPEPEPEEDIEVDLTEQEETPIPVIDEKLDTDIMTQTAAAATLTGFTKLARDIQVNRTFDGITLEDVVRAQLEPLLREWLDKNLPPMIEVLVEKELEKLSKKALND